MAAASRILGPAAPPPPALLHRRRESHAAARPQSGKPPQKAPRVTHTETEPWSHPDTSPPAGTRIDEKTDFYPLETGSVLTHGRPPEAASCPHSSGTPPAASAPNTSVNEPKQTACAGVSPPEGACLHPPSFGRKPSLAQGAGGGSAAARFGVIRGNRAAAKARGRLPARTRGRSEVRKPRRYLPNQAG